MADDDDLLYGDLYGEDAYSGSTSGFQQQQQQQGSSGGGGAGLSTIQSFSSNEDERRQPPRMPGYNDAFNARPVPSFGGGGGAVQHHQPFQNNAFASTSNANSGGTIYTDGKMFVGGLNWETTEDTLVAYFSQYGTVVSCNIMRDNTNGRSRGFAFLTFNESTAVDAVLAHPHYLDGKNVRFQAMLFCEEEGPDDAQIDPKRAVPPPNKQRAMEEPPTEKLFVRSIGPEITQEAFREYFTKYGGWTACTLMMDKETGVNRGYGFVDYNSPTSVDQVLQSAPHYIMGQLVDCKKSIPKTRRDGNPGAPGPGGGYADTHAIPLGHSGGGQSPLPQSAPAVPPVPTAPAMTGPFDPQAVATYFARLVNGNASLLAGFDPAAMIKAINAAPPPQPVQSFAPPQPIRSNVVPSSGLMQINTFMSDTPPAAKPSFTAHQQQQASSGAYGGFEPLYGGPQQQPFARPNANPLSVSGSSPPPPDAPRGPASMRPAPTGPSRTARGGASFHPYQRG